MFRDSSRNSGLLCHGLRPWVRGPTSPWKSFLHQLTVAGCVTWTLPGRLSEPNLINPWSRVLPSSHTKCLQVASGITRASLAACLKYCQFTHDTVCCSSWELLLLLGIGSWEEQQTVSCVNNNLLHVRIQLTVDHPPWTSPPFSSFLHLCMLSSLPCRRVFHNLPPDSPVLQLSANSPVQARKARFKLEALKRTQEQVRDDSICDMWQAVFLGRM